MGFYLSAAEYAIFMLFLFSQTAHLCLCKNSSIAGCLEQERQALLKFKATLIDPSNMLSSWINGSSDCCLWNGISCDNLTGHVSKLDLSGNFLEAAYTNAALDPSLMELHHLSHLDLSINNFHASPIPSFFASMKQLTYLSLSNANFSGKLPLSLGNLTDLKFLDLSLNDDLYCDDMNWASELVSLQYLNMSGVHLGKAHNLFQVIFMLPSLLELHLSECGLHTLIPPQYVPLNLTYFPRVEVLDLTYNELEVPFLDVFQNMTSVRVLDLSFNNLSSLPLWLNKFHNLSELYVAENVIFGPLPSVLRNLTSSIRVLELSGNNLTLVPTWLGELKSLQFLNLASNQLTLESSLSLILRDMCDLQSLDLSHNKLQGEAFGEYELSGCVQYVLEDLDLSYNNEFEDCLPTWLGQLESLQYIHISETSIYGPIPFALGKLTQLTKLDLVGNHLNGSIPDSLSLLVNLTFLRLSYNRLEGVIPDNLSQLVNLNLLDLSNNNLNGTIPSSLGKLVNLEYLSLSSNSLHGTIPEDFDQLVNLVELELSSNALEGEFSKIIGRSSFNDLSILDLFNNHISGSLPENISDIMPALTSLDLRNNSITGPIPSSLCKIEKLSVLDLSKNKLSGEIPNCWRSTNQSYWDEINLSSNKLSGVFPTSFGNLSSLSWLHLNNNNLQGELPSMLSTNLKQLVILDVGENQFSGSIPPWTANTFPSLQILRLRQNMLNGTIPSQLCQLTSLQILDLADNNLIGSLPHCLGNLTGMTKAILSVEAKEKFDFNFLVSNFIDEWYDKDVEQVLKGTERDYLKNLKFLVNMDFSSNRLGGVIPEEITWLIGLHGLNLSYNHFNGEIPKMIGNMKSLESFDISHNKISGKIPTGISALTSLGYFNVSYNNLSGPIPRENQFLTLADPYNYVGNSYLCGFPLPNKCFDDDDSNHVPESSKESEDGNSENVWFYFVIAVGFATGFWGVIGILVLKRSWRQAWFQWADKTAEKISVAIEIKVEKLKRMVRNHDNSR